MKTKASFHRNIARAKYRFKHRGVNAPTRAARSTFFVASDMRGEAKESFQSWVR